MVHGAFELFRHASTIFENQEMQTSLEEGIEAAKVEENLEKMGAQLLKKPDGWHWISPRGEMHHLAKADETGKALEKLKELRSPKKKKKAPEPKAEAKAEPKADKEEPAKK